MEKHYRTSSLAFAATLVTMGEKLIRLDQSPSTQKRDIKDFVFACSETEPFDEMRRAFYAHELKVDAMALCDNLNILKQRLFAFRSTTPTEQVSER